MQFSVVIRIFTAGLILFRRGATSGLDKYFTIIADKLNFTEAEKKCKSLGFDGLAITSSPEEFVYLIEATVKHRETLGEWLGLRYDSRLDRILWDDGTVSAPEVPWVSSQSDADPNRPCGRLHVSGSLGMIGCHFLRYSVCGNHTKVYLEAEGTTYNFTSPAKVTSSLTELKAESYLQCVILCGRNYLCRAAHFHLVTNICKILGPGSYADLQKDADSKTFVRRPYT
ncbi:hypothetical protein PoB_002746500 [Plakobranchus ocellatus]|uniref:C-type lectin domain-containing protein n=1 Tax=Plakobranchus ocellatus TaxID=259542 RepID=A0AAV4A219_9GAST|nr:hypothetical protein PoB_002746500 [Plakobranchus ocellatus]